MYYLEECRYSTVLGHFWRDHWIFPTIEVTGVQELFVYQHSFKYLCVQTNKCIQVWKKQEWKCLGELSLKMSLESDACQDVMRWVPQSSTISETELTLSVIKSLICFTLCNRLFSSLSTILSFISVVISNAVLRETDKVDTKNVDCVTSPNLCEHNF